mmetsp:Transcript_45688/g.85302  ORF Transcript_45688/g.85302 Transcript_45688/m.85302 type:complete len:173 (-) Transcript_45688:262-780(-)
MNASRLVILLGILYIVDASRGDEPLVEIDYEEKTPPGQLSGISDRITAVQDWLFLTGPSPLVAATTRRAWLRTIFIFGLASFAMVMQIRSALATLRRGMNQLSKLDDQARPEPMSPAAFLAASEEAASLQRQRLADYRLRCLERQRETSSRRARSAPAPTNSDVVLRRSRSR